MGGRPSASEPLVSAGSSAWDEYTAWNAAIAEVAFSPAHADRPVYLDLDEDNLAAIAERVGCADPNPEERLGQVVRKTLALPPKPGPMFRLHTTRLQTWARTSRLDPPPVLAVLAAFVLAAEAMEKGGGMAPHNYYGRLQDVLGLDATLRKKLEHDYRDAAEFLFGGLTGWLNATGGAHGLPTALASPPHPYVALPVSQALVRADDRARLRRMFADYGLAPGEGLPQAHMQVLIAQWVQEGHGSASFRRLWGGSQDVKQRVVELAVAELLVWDGAGLAERASGDLRIVAELRTFLGRRITVSLSAEVAGASSAIALEALDGSGRPLGQIEFVGDGAGRMLAANPGAIAAASILSGRIRLRDGTGTELAHQPRALYVLQREEGAQMAVERERVALGGDCVILSLLRLRKTVEDLLREVARPGWRVEEDLRGLPDGWVCISGVQVMSLPSKSLAFYPAEIGALIPAAVSQIVVSDGLAIPGVTRRWSSLRPPEVRVVAVGGAEIEVVLRQQGDLGQAPLHSEVSEDGIVVFPLAPLGLRDGDYEVEVETDGRDGQQTRAIRLRSSGWPDVPVPVGLVAHDGADGLWPLTATAAHIDGPFVVGPRTAGEFPSRDPIARRLGSPRWPDARRSQRAAAEEGAVPVRAVADIPVDDCVESGRHVMLLPEAKKRGSIEGICDNCGLVKRYPATWSELAHAHGRPARSERPRPKVVFAPPVRSPDDVGADWASVVDSVFYLRSGRDADIGRLAAQLPPADASDTPSIATDRLLRALEAAAHLEVVRTPDGRPASWQVAPPSLAGLGARTFALTGWRSAAYLGTLADAVQAAGGVLEAGSALGAPPVVLVRELDAEALREACAVFGLDPLPVVVEDAGAELARALPPLSSVLEALPDVPVPAARILKTWDPVTAKWQRTGAARAGGMQFAGFTTVYGFVYADGRQLRMKPGDTRLVKHLSALASKYPLIVYSPENEQLVVPMGADLPGLYGRAAVLASGRLPVVNERMGALIYESVPGEVATTLISRLES